MGKEEQKRLRGSFIVFDLKGSCPDSILFAVDTSQRFSMTSLIVRLQRAKLRHGVRFRDSFVSWRVPCCVCGQLHIEGFGEWQQIVIVTAEGRRQ